MSSLDLFGQPDSPLLPAGLPSAPSAIPGFKLPVVNLNDAFRAIVVPGTGTDAARYTLSGFDYLDLVTVSASVDLGAVVAPVQVAVEFFDQSGPRFAMNASGAGLTGVNIGEVTFAAQLPDTSTLPPPTTTAFLQTGMPVVLLQPGSSVQVRALDPAAIVTEMRLWVWNANVRAGDLRIPSAIRLPTAA